MVFLIIFLSKTRINFIHVNITYGYVTEFTLAEPTYLQRRNFWRDLDYVASTSPKSNLPKLPKYNCRITLDLHTLLAG